jgi:hypothetical protein
VNFSCSHIKVAVSEDVVFMLHDRVVLYTSDSEVDDNVTTTLLPLSFVLCYLFRDASCVLKLTTSSFLFLGVVVSISDDCYSTPERLEMGELDRAQAIDDRHDTG